jgi:hypothetical protein
MIAQGARARQLCTSAEKQGSRLTPHVSVGYGAKRVFATEVGHAVAVRVYDLILAVVGRLRGWPAWSMIRAW